MPEKILLLDNIFECEDPGGGVISFCVLALVTFLSGSEDTKTKFMSIIELLDSISLGIISRFTIIQEIYNHSKSQEWAEHACNANLSTFHSFLSTIFSPLQQTFVSITTALASHNLDFKDKNNDFVVDLRTFTSDTCIALIKTVPNDQCGLVSTGLSIRTLGIAPRQRPGTTRTS